MKTKVIFLIEKDSENEVFAYFPFEKYDNQGNRTCYAHIGQHSACSPLYAAECKTASPEQYKDLKKELENIGYDLETINEGETRAEFLPEPEFFEEEIPEEETPGDIFEA